MISIVIANQKGGVGKTLTAVNLAVNFANNGYKTLAVDLDTQQSLGISLTNYLGEDLDQMNTIDRLLLNNDLSPEDCIIPSEFENLYVLPSSERCETLGEKLKDNAFVPSYDHIRRKLSKLNDLYDIAIFDCPGNLNTLPINAMCFADYLLIPMSASRLSMDAFFSTVKVMNSCQEINPNLKLLGVLMNFYQKQTKVAKFAVEQLETSGYPLLESKIRSSIKVDESTYAEPIILGNPNSPITQDFLSLYQEVCEKIGLAESKRGE